MIFLAQILREINYGESRGVFTCSILASIVAILVSIEVILTSIEPILEKCVLLQV